MDDIFIGRTKIKAYKTVCLKLGLIMCVFFICKIAASFVIGLIGILEPQMSRTALYLSSYIISIMFVYMAPMKKT